MMTRSTLARASRLALLGRALLVVLGAPECPCSCSCWR
jgi:hypothetical protein